MQRTRYLNEWIIDFFSGHIWTHYGWNRISKHKDLMNKMLVMFIIFIEKGNFFFGKEIQINHTNLWRFCFFWFNSWIDEQTLKHSIEKKMMNPGTMTIQELLLGSFFSFFSFNLVKQQQIPVYTNTDTHTRRRKTQQTKKRGVYFTTVSLYIIGNAAKSNNQNQNQTKRPKLSKLIEWDDHTNTHHHHGGKIRGGYTRINSEKAQSHNRWQRPKHSFKQSKK